MDNGTVTIANNPSPKRPDQRPGGLTVKPGQESSHRCDGRRHSTATPMARSARVANTVPGRLVVATWMDRKCCRRAARYDLQRTRTFIGPTNWSNVTFQADVRAPERRRQMADVGSLRTLFARPCSMAPRSS
jgi:hypothetical protein